MLLLQFCNSDRRDKTPAEHEEFYNYSLLYEPYSLSVELFAKDILNKHRQTRQDRHYIYWFQSEVISVLETSL